MVSMALWLNLRNVPLEEEEEETLEISTRTAAAELPQLKRHFTTYKGVLSDI